MGNNENGAIIILSHTLKYLNQVLEAPKVDSRLRLVKYRQLCPSCKNSGNLNAL